MSKRLILMVVLVVSVFTGTAQIANRSGIFVEAGVGGLVGNTLVDAGKSTVTESGKMTITTKSGVSYDLMAGYRWAFSRNWALDGHIGFDNPGIMILDIMPGIRYTTDDFIANRSLFFQANAGVGFTFESGYFETELVSLVFQLQGGVNITNRLYAGIYYLGHSMSYSGVSVSDFNTTRNFGTLGLRLGYRF